MGKDKNWFQHQTAHRLIPFKQLGHLVQDQPDHLIFEPHINRRLSIIRLV